MIDDSYNLVTPNTEEFTMEGIEAGILPTTAAVDKTKDQLRVFMIAQARRELQRVIKLTEAINKLEDKYINASTEYLTIYGDAETAVTFIPQMVDTLSKSLQRSNDLINKITGNKELMQLVINQQNINIDNTNNNSENIYGEIDLSNSTSRERVRNFVESLLNSPDLDISEILNNNEEENI